MRKGPTLPVAIQFPCILNINEDIQFIIGANSYANETFNKTKAFLFNQTNDKWTFVGYNFPCQYQLTHSTRFTCSNLKHEHLAVVSVHNCIAVFNLTSHKWISIKMRHENGILFNVNSEQDEVFYIGSDREQGSDIFMVNTHLVFFFSLQ